MSLTKHIPNALTCANLLCGCLGILSLFTDYIEPAFFIWAACVFDFLDGFVARLLKVSSPIGKELDSLADMVSFGVLPSLTMFYWLRAVSDTDYLAYVSLMLAVFSALRLAKFNVDTRQTNSFIGIPTPANALFITALTFLPPVIRDLVFTTPVLIIITIWFSLLMVAPLELFALKFKNFTWADNRLRFTFLALSVFLLVFLQAGAIPFIILLYVVASLGNKALVSNKN